MRHVCLYICTHIHIYNTCTRVCAHIHRCAWYICIHACAYVYVICVYIVYLFGEGGKKTSKAKILSFLYTKELKRHQHRAHKNSEIRIRRSGF